MPAEVVPYGGWPRNLQLKNAFAELVVTLDVGPRVLCFQRPGGENIFKNYDAQLGGTGESEWMIRGGHRGWLAPEMGLTYSLDNDSVEYELTGEHSVRLHNPPANPWQIAKELEISLDADAAAATVVHRAINRGTEPVTLATWGLSVMCPGGLEVIPLPTLGQHPRDLLPERLIVPWPYTDLSDERWRFGSRFITLRQTEGGVPAKLGLAHRQKWVAYLMRDDLFLKTFDYLPGETYPDFGCNFETFTNHEMLEIESLSPLRSLAPGESIEHTERWFLFSEISQPESLKESALTEWLAPYLARIGLR